MYMGIVTSRVQKTLQQRSTLMSLDDRAGALIHFLNGTVGGEPAQKKLCNPRALLVMVKRLQTIEAAASKGGHTIPEESLMRLYRSINRFLSHYKAQPFILPLSSAEQWEFWWSPLVPMKSLELDLVLLTIEIAQAKRISSLKQCEQCRNWLFARFPHQRFCKEICKEHFHRFNEADKKRRREWARHNYWLQKNKNVK